jgi:hypothetical protein
MTPSENRAASRKPLRIEAPLVDTRSGRFLRGRTRDVSTAGMFIELDTPLPVGAVVDCFLGGMGTGLQLLGRVVRDERDGFAVKFTSDTTALARLLA